ncbi:MAG: TPM domain-containing protein [candidate division NC10 bacterium]|nr:TPM domain-containing protein [candidate division NC10 bacterium]MDE2321818.1 TPM domain-containing protein [candidate division NC10 bacterium]
MPPDRRLSSPSHFIYRWLPLYCALALCLFSGSPSAGISLPKPEGWVSDLAGLLDASTKHRLELFLTEVNRQTGVEIAVVTIPNLGGQSVEEVAVEAFTAWGIGKKGQDEGMLLLIAPTERRLRIEVGYGLEETIPDGLAGEIIRDTITPRFREGQFAEGIEAGIARIVEIIARHKQIQIPSPDSYRLQAPVPERRTGSVHLVSQTTPVLLFLLLLVGLIAISMASERSFRRRDPRGFRNRFIWFPIGPYSGGWSGGGFGSSGFGGFGGFGGGSSGGGGASGSW